MLTALREIERHPRIAGVFLWKWFRTQRSLDHEFALQLPAMKQVIRDAWSGSPRPLAERWHRLSGAANPLSPSVR